MLPSEFSPQMLAVDLSPAKETVENGEEVSEKQIPALSCLI